MPNYVNITLKVDKSQVPIIKRAFGDVQKQSEDAHMKISNSAKKTSLDIKKIAGSYLGITASIGGTILAIKKSVSAFMEQEKAELKLAVAMKNTGDFTRANFTALKNYAGQLQKLTEYGDEVTLMTMANLKTYGMNTEELKKATRATMDLASAKGIDLKAASDLIGKAFVGETGSLSRYGIVLEKGIPKTEKFAAVLELINHRFGGSAQADIESYSGQLKQMSNWWGDITEKVGFGMLKSLEAVLTAIGWLSSGFYKFFETVTRGWSELFGLLGKIPIIGDQFKKLSETLRFASDSYRMAGKETMNFSQKNFTILKSMDKVEKAIERQIEKEKTLGVEYKNTSKIADKETKKAIILMDAHVKERDKWLYEEARKQEKLAQQKIELERKTLDEINYMSVSAHDSEMYKLNREYEKRKEILGDSVDLYIWYTGRVNELEIKKTENLSYQNQTYWEGVKWGWNKYVTTELPAYSQITVSMFQGISNSATSSMSNLFYNISEGSAKTSEVWASMLDSMKRMLFDAVAQMITKWLLLKATMAATSFFGGGGDTGGNIGSGIATNVATSAGKTAVTSYLGKTAAEKGAETIAAKTAATKASTTTASTAAGSSAWGAVATAGAAATFVAAIGGMIHGLATWSEGGTSLTDLGWPQSIQDQIRRNTPWGFSMGISKPIYYQPGMSPDELGIWYKPPPGRTVAEQAKEALNLGRISYDQYKNIVEHPSDLSALTYRAHNGAIITKTGRVISAKNKEVPILAEYGETISKGDGKTIIIEKVIDNSGGVMITDETAYNAFVNKLSNSLYELQRYEN